MSIDIEKLIEDFKNNFIPNKKANIVKMSELLQALEQLQAEIERLKSKESETHVFVGYTNGLQLLYATEKEEGEGSLYCNRYDNCDIPLYMLKTHLHRIESTSGMCVTPEMLFNNSLPNPHELKEQSE